MGLFSKKEKELKPDYEVSYDSKRLGTSIAGMAEPIYQSKRDGGHRAFKILTEKILNLEILELSKMRIGHNVNEEFAHKLGRIEGLRSLLHSEQQLIANWEQKKAAKGKEKSAEKTTSYLQPRSGHAAGLA